MPIVGKSEGPAVCGDPYPGERKPGEQYTLAKFDKWRRCSLLPGHRTDHNNGAVSWPKEEAHEGR